MGEAFGDITAICLLRYTKYNLHNTTLAHLTVLAKVDFNLT